MRKYFKVKSKESRIGLIGIEFNNWRAERDVIMSFLIEVLGISIEEASIVINSLTSVQKETRCRNYVFEIKDHTLFVDEESEEFYIKEISRIL